MEVVVGHGLYFDTSIIKANALRLKKQELYEKLTELLHKDKRVDTMQKTIKFCGLKKYPKLGELYQKLFDEEFDGHCAANDVEATYKCYNRLVELNVLFKNVFPLLPVMNAFPVALAGLSPKNVLCAIKLFVTVLKNNALVDAEGV